LPLGKGWMDTSRWMKTPQPALVKRPGPSLAGQPKQGGLDVV
jgi:hypothetical protein